MNTRDLAIYFAGNAHRDQMYGESPYLFHLDAVDDVLNEACYGENDAVRIAAYLHDTIEDSEGRVTEEILRKRFGKTVADLVWRVTNEPGDNRSERAKKTYPKIAAEPMAVALKLADRIANLRHSIKTYSKFGLMYVREDAEFTKALYSQEHVNRSPDRLGWLWKQYRYAVEEIQELFGEAA